MSQHIWKLLYLQNVYFQISVIFTYFGFNLLCSPNLMANPSEFIGFSKLVKLIKLFVRRVTNLTIICVPIVLIGLRCRSVKRNPICTGGAHNERTPINIYPSFLNKWSHLPVLSWLLIFFLCRHDCENFFLKIQSYPDVCRHLSNKVSGPKMGKCGLDSIFWLNHYSGHK